MKPKKIIILVGVILTFMVVSSEAGWLIYHKPTFEGQVIDSKTKEPLEGAVVVVAYFKHIFRFMPESGTVVIHVRETLTDKEGNFRIPSYTTIIDPFAWEAWASFIIFKPGYGNYPNYQISPPGVGVDAEEFFSKGKTGTRGVMVWEGIGTMFNVTFGVVELPKLKTREDRLKAESISVSDLRSKDLPLLYKALNEEERYLGIPERE